MISALCSTCIVGYKTFHVYFFVKFPELPPAGTGQELIHVIVRSIMDWHMYSRSEVNKRINCSQILYLFVRFSLHVSRQLANVVSIYFRYSSFVSFRLIYNRFVFFSRTSTGKIENLHPCKNHVKIM